MQMTDRAQAFFESLSSAAAVQSLVGEPENLYFDAKICAVPLSKEDKKHLAEGLSGFANSDGGVLVYGLVAKGGDQKTPDVVSSVKPVRKLKQLHAEVLSLVGQIVQPPVQKVQVVSRELSRTPGRGFLIIFVPRSDAFLHRSASDREYYRRHGHGFFRMEHYEIAEFYGRRRSPTLTFWWRVKLGGWTGSSPHRTVLVQVIVGLENVGRAIAKYPALLIRTQRFPLYVPDSYGLDGSGKTGLPERPTSSPNTFLFGGGSDDVVYPGVVLQVTALRRELVIREDDPHCVDVSIDYEVYAEDMPFVKDTAVLRGADIIEKVGIAQ